MTDAVRWRREDRKAVRQRELITLLEGSDRPVGGPEIAVQLGTSTRTIRTDVAEINDKAGDLAIVSEHRGYRLRAVPPVALRETPVDRLVKVLRSLIRCTEGISVLTLAEQHWVSDSSIEADLSKARPMLAAHDLRIHRSGQVVTIVGGEADKRSFLRELLLDVTRASGTPSARDEIALRTLPSTRAVVSEVLRKASNLAHDLVIEDIAQHLSILIERAADGQTLEQASESELSSAWQDLAGELCEALSDSTGVELAAGEVSYVATLLSYRLALESEVQVAGGDDEYVVLTRRILADIDAAFALELSQLHDVDRLVLHLRMAVMRARLGKRASTPLGDRFRQDHPLMSELASFFADRAEQHLNIVIDADEVTLLSMHLGSLLAQISDADGRVRVAFFSTTGHPALAQTVEMVRAALGDLAEVLDDPAASEPEPSIDLVLYSLSPPGDGQGKALQISMLPTQRALQELRGTVQLIAERRARTRVKRMLSELLDPRLFVRLRGEHSSSDVLEELSDLLLEQQVVESSFLEEVMERERLAPTSFGNQLAIPHSVKMNANRTAVAVALSESPITWGASKVRLVVLFALSEGGHTVFRDGLDSLIATLGEPEHVAALAMTTSYDDFVEELMRLLS